MNNFTKIVIIFLVVLALALAGFLFLDDKFNFGKDEAKTEDHACLADQGYLWCEAKNKCQRFFEEFCPDEVAIMVDSIKNETGVSLSYFGESEFNWIASNGEVATDAKIAGVLYSAENVQRADYEKIEGYMDYNFKNSLYNLADGVVGGLRGYYTEYLVCHLNFRHAKIKENAEGLSEPDGDNLKVTLECGYFNRTDMAKAIIAEIVRGEMAKKYQKNIDEVSAVVTKIEHNFAAGSIKFGQGGQGEGGMFLAARINEQWQVVFDGNGSIDCDRMRQEYQFPDEILKPNFCD